MIERYTRPEMGRIWTEENKYNIWLEIEVLAVEAMAKLGQVPEEAAKHIRNTAKCDVDKINEIEKVLDPLRSILQERIVQEYRNRTQN